MLLETKLPSFFFAILSKYQNCIVPVCGPLIPRNRLLPIFKVEVSYHNIYHYINITIHKVARCYDTCSLESKLPLYLYCHNTVNNTVIVSFPVCVSFQGIVYYPNSWCKSVIIIDTRCARDWEHEETSKILKSNVKNL